MSASASIGTSYCKDSELLLAFSTSSSAAVMPLSIKTAEDKLGVRPSVSQFVIPLGTTINMNGTALYQEVDRILDMSRTAINVCGDLVAAKLMDRWVGGKTTAEEQAAAEVVREEVRTATGQDVISN